MKSIPEELHDAFVCQIAVMQDKIAARVRYAFEPTVAEVANTTR